MPPTSEPSSRGGTCRTRYAATGAASTPPSRIAAAQVQSMPCEPRLNRNPRLAARATMNSLVSIEPITLRGSMRPLASSAGDADLGDDLPVDVAELPVGESGHQGGADLGQVHGGGSGRRVGPDGQQQRSGGDAVGHAEASVDELRDEADQGD